MKPSFYTNGTRYLLNITFFILKIVYFYYMIFPFSFLRSVILYGLLFAFLIPE